MWSWCYCMPLTGVGGIINKPVWQSIFLGIFSGICVWAMCSLQVFCQPCLWGIAFLGSQCLGILVGWLMQDSYSSHHPLMRSWLLRYCRRIDLVLQTDLLPNCAGSCLAGRHIRQMLPFLVYMYVFATLRVDLFCVGFWCTSADTSCCNGQCVCRHDTSRILPGHATSVQASSFPYYLHDDFLVCRKWSISLLVFQNPFSQHHDELLHACGWLPLSDPSVHLCLIAT